MGFSENGEKKMKILSVILLGIVDVGLNRIDCEWFFGERW